MILCHPPDLEQPQGIERLWGQALDDAEVGADTSLLVLVAAERSQGAKYAMYLAAGRSLDAGVSDEFDIVLNGDEHVGLERVILWVNDVPAAGICAAILRHELEHACQCRTDPKALEVMNLAEEVVAHAKEGSGVIYNKIPSEVRANASGARFSRNLFGDEAIDALVEEFPEFGALLAESWSAALPVEGVVEAILKFIASLPDLCQRHGFVEVALGEELAARFRSLVELEESASADGA